MKGSIGSAIVIIAYVVVLFVLVRPGSQGPQFVSSVSGGISNVIGAATGGGTWATA